MIARDSEDEEMKRVREALDSIHAAWVFIRPIAFHAFLIVGAVYMAWRAL